MFCSGGCRIEGPVGTWLVDNPALLVSGGQCPAARIAPPSERRDNSRKSITSFWQRFTVYTRNRTKIPRASAWWKRNALFAQPSEATPAEDGPPSPTRLRLPLLPMHYKEWQMQYQQQSQSHARSNARFFQLECPNTPARTAPDRPPHFHFSPLSGKINILGCFALFLTPRRLRRYSFFLFVYLNHSTIPYVYLPRTPNYNQIPSNNITLL